MVEKLQICMLKAGEIYQQSNTLCLPCSSIGLLLLDTIGYMAICYTDSLVWLFLLQIHGKCVC